MRLHSKHQVSLKLFSSVLILALHGALGASEAAGASPANWPQWRGPDMNGTSSLSGLPADWSTTKNVRWATPLPAWSGSSPVVWEDTVFVTSPGPQSNPAQGRRDPGADQIYLIAINRGDGSIRWQKLLGTDNQLLMKQNMASPSPVTDGTHVWAMTGQGDLVAFDFAGEEAWRRNLQKDYGAFGLNWGFAASPLLYHDRLIIPVLHGMKTDDPSYLVAIEKTSGETLWKTNRPTKAVKESPDAYTTPQVFRRGERDEIVVNGADIVTSHDPATGEELWRVDGLNPQKHGNYRVVGSALVVGGLIVAPTRVEPMIAIRPGEGEGVGPDNIVWQARGADVPTPVSDGKHLWVVNDRGALSCLDIETGRDVYPPQRLARGTYSASPVLADGKIYATSEDGTTTVVEAGPQFKVLAINKLEDAYTLSSPAVAHGEIFIRTSNKLYCIANP